VKIERSDMKNVLKAIDELIMLMNMCMDMLVRIINLERGRMRDELRVNFIEKGELLNGERFRVERVIKE
jgi:hypothetical protein